MAEKHKIPEMKTARRKNLNRKKSRKGFLSFLLVLLVLFVSSVPAVKLKADTKIPVSLKATFKNGTVLPYTTLTNDMFTVTLTYNTGASEAITDFTINPTYVTAEGENRIAISYYTGTVNLSTTCYVTCSPITPDTKFSIYFNSNGGTYCDPIYDITPNTTVSLPTPPTKTNYWFRGWFTDAALTDEFTDFTKVTKNLNLYAKWEQKTEGDNLSDSITNGIYTSRITINLAGQDYDSSVQLRAQALKPEAVEKAVKKIADTTKYLGFELNVAGYLFDSRMPLPVIITIPSGFDLSKTFVYYTTNRMSVMSKVQGSVINGAYQFNAYESGTYILMEAEDEKKNTNSSSEEKPILTLSNIGTLAVNEQVAVEMTFKYFYEDPSDYKFLWKSSNSKVASVDSDGIVTGKKIGAATITCYTKSGKFKATTKVKVVSNGVVAAKITPNVTKKTIKKGKTYQLKVKITPSNTKIKTLSYTSSNPSVASVNSKGKITAKKKGTSVITIKTKDGSNLTKKVKITVIG